MQAQQVFSEGKINYLVYADGSDQSIGSYTISIKGNFIKSDYELNNGFKSETIYNGKEGTSATLKVIQNSAYALMQTKAEIDEANKAFAKAKYTYGSDTKKIAGYNTTSCEVSYGSGKKATLFLTKELKTESDKLLAMFPGLEGIPLEYSIDNGNSSLRFSAQTVEIRNMDSEEFSIPKNYKIVTKKELDGLR